MSHANPIPLVKRSRLEAEIQGGSHAISRPVPF